MDLFSFNLWMDILITTIKFFWFLIEGIVNALLPLTYLKVKPLKSETALITEAGKGIGRKLAIELAKRGNTVVVWDEDAEAVEETAGEIKKFGGKVYCYEVDMSVQENVIAAAAEMKRQVPTPISLLINNANARVEKSIQRMLPDVYTRKLMDVNMMSHFWTMMEFLPSMLERGEGHLVAIAHIPDSIAQMHTVDYIASKSAVTGLMESLSEMLGDKQGDIVCSTILPEIVTQRPFPSAKNELLKPLMGPINEEEIVKSIIQAIQANRTVAYVPRVNGYWVMLKHVLPFKAYKLFKERILDATGYNLYTDMGAADYSDVDPNKKSYLFDDEKDDNAVYSPEYGTMDCLGA